MSGPPGAVASRRSAIATGPWTWLHQVHGAGVVVATSPGHQAGARADAAVTTTPGVVLAVHTADCAPLLLLADGGVGVVHAGWRGLLAGVVEATAAAMAAVGAPAQTAVLGPCIRAHCYEFGRVELDLVAERYGDVVRTTTSAGAPALDLAAGVAAACGALDLPLEDSGACTACSPRHFSHRARADTGRQALVARLDP